MNAEVIAFRSVLDGTEQRAGLCGPDDSSGTDGSSELLPLLVELEPGSILDLDGTLPGGRRHLELVGEPAVWLRPGGRGPGTVFQGPGEVDVFEAIAAAMERSPIDPNRISLYGSSMGGAGVWFLASHYPDRFAAIAPFCGYNDYRLWTRPGGMTFPLQPWEEPSWRARSAIFLLENLRHVGIWMVHGEWDRAVGGGVDVAHSRNSAARLAELGIPFRYTEVAQAGHDEKILSEDNLAVALPWLAAQRRVVAPVDVMLTAYDLGHATAWWVSIDQLARYGDAPGRISARATDELVTVETENVRHLRIGPTPGAHSGTHLVIDGHRLERADLRQVVAARRQPDGTWHVAEEPPPPGEKRSGLGGPFGDLFLRPTILVPGTLGSDEDTYIQRWCAESAIRFFRDWNGGVHRGGLRGDSSTSFEIRTDSELTVQPDPAANLVAFGTPATNAVLPTYADRLGIEFGDGEIRVGGRRFSGRTPAVIAIRPRPDGGDRYLAIHGGTSPDAITWGAHLHWQLLPDWLVYDRDAVLGWGFFDNDWRA
jgi:hypothetical protein